MYLYNLHNKKKVRSRIPKSTDNLHNTSFFGPTIKKKEKTWSSIQNKLRIYANDKSEYMLGKLRDDNADAVAEAKKFLAIDYRNKTDRQALTSYYVGKHAKKTDEWFKTRDQAGMISLTDELNYLQSAMELDETFSKTKFEKIERNIKHLLLRLVWYLLGSFDRSAVSLSNIKVILIYC